MHVEIYNTTKSTILFQWFGGKSISIVDSLDVSYIRNQWHLAPIGYIRDSACRQNKKKTIYLRHNIFHHQRVFLGIMLLP